VIHDSLKWVPESAHTRATLNKTNPNLYHELTKVFFEFDPIGINYDTNHNEYVPEVGTILPRLTDCKDVDDARKVIHEEFVRWFAGECLAGKEDEYQEVAKAVWEIWTEYRRRRHNTPE